ncbi:MAG: M13 family metallopeptidase [Cytophagales bacterium]|jgi:predicted metalloendopeptidase|nr:M13 family metallopeptidase [Cytophagales bacterium]
MMAIVDKMVEEKYKVDDKIHPGNDFYKYVCGNWIKKILYLKLIRDMEFLRG